MSEPKGPPPNAPTVHVEVSGEEIDIDAWVTRYVRTVMDLEGIQVDSSKAPERARRMRGHATR